MKSPFKFSPYGHCGKLISEAVAPLGRLRDEVEDLARTAIEVTVLWNRTALHVAHLDDDHGFALTSVAPSLPSPARPMLPALGLGGVYYQSAVLFAALPTATSAYILAVRMGGDGPGVAWLVTVSTMTAMLTLPVWLTLL